MIGWIILGLYALGYIVFAPVLARVIAGYGDSHEVTREDRVLGAFIALLAALLWPLVIPGAWVYKRAFPKEDR